MSSLPRPIFRSFKDIGRTWFNRTRPSYLESRPSMEFTVASYNVLADKLLHDHPHLYFNRGRQESWIFDWNYRKRNLLEEIKCSDADVSTVCRSSFFSTEIFLSLYRNGSLWST